MVVLRRSKKVAPGTVVYPELKVIEYRGLTGLKAQDSKDLLGWEEVSEPSKDTVPEIFALTGLHVKLNKNTNNRFLTTWQLQNIRQEHLHGHWEFNGMTIVIGRMGNVQAGQHRLIGHVLADIEWHGPNRAHYEVTCPVPPVLDTLVVYGIDESDKVFRTLNCEVRSRPADVIYRSDHFADLARDDRKIAARLTEAAVKLLWVRTGRKVSKIDGRLTNAEATEFLIHHRKLIDCVRHIMAENTAVRDDEGKLLTNSVSRYISPGYASALMYLMAASATDGDEYRNQEVRGEKKVSFTNRKMAEGFWSGLAKGDKALQEVSVAIGNLSNGENPASLSEVKAVLCKAWNAYAEDKPITKKALKLEYREEEGGKELDEFPNVGGIDLGEKYTLPNESEVPDPEEIAEQAKIIKEEGLKEKASAPNGKPRKKKETVIDASPVADLVLPNKGHPDHKRILPPGPLDGCI